MEKVINPIIFFTYLKRSHKYFDVVSLGSVIVVHVR